mmetsp:Transcript_3418/g.6783  ORF Transcript_3418/g.6783 Transcript_3418/m.6783 type:complete len:206 (-) Transcript_3418:210-827(-)
MRMDWSKACKHSTKRESSSCTSLATQSLPSSCNICTNDSFPKAFSSSAQEEKEVDSEKPFGPFLFLLLPHFSSLAADSLCERDVTSFGLSFRIKGETSFAGAGGLLFRVVLANVGAPGSTATDAAFLIVRLRGEANKLREPGLVLPTTAIKSFDCTSPFCSRFSSMRFSKSALADLTLLILGGGHYYRTVAKNESDRILEGHPHS